MYHVTKSFNPNINHYRVGRYHFLGERECFYSEYFDWRGGIGVVQSHLEIVFAPNKR